MMQFLVLGYIPGTDIQITFDMIATVASVIALFYLTFILIKEEKLIQQKKYVKTVKLSKIIKSITI